LLSLTEEQKLTAISTTSALVAIGTTDDKVSILRYPSLEPAAEGIELDTELVDLDWGGEGGEWVSWVFHIEFQLIMV
jgi:prolactin regulatory element-binding protein